MADVTKAELDALTKRVAELEKTKIKVSGEPDNAIEVEADGGWFVPKGPAQADVDKLSTEVGTLTTAGTKTDAEIQKLTAAETKTTTDLAALDKEFRALVTKEDQTATAVSQAAKAAHVTQLEKELHELAAEHKKTADALSQAATATQVDHLEKQLQDLSAKHDQVANALVEYTAGEGIKFEPTP